MRKKIEQTKTKFSRHSAHCEVQHPIPPAGVPKNSPEINPDALAAPVVLRNDFRADTGIRVDFQQH